ncbi:MAG: hypothetical protein K2H40_03320, partial [Lachnospiraceae bacterium]|nr:hypothetical protein [Lachnospiraceae bacterium]
MKKKGFSPWEARICTFAKYAGVLGISILAGLALLFVVYALPVGNMKANVARSSEIFNYEGIYPQMVSGYKYMQLDNFTDSLMLGAAIYDGPEGMIDKVVNNYHPDSGQISPELALTNYANEVSAYEYFQVPYGRYWHGYLIPLKLLLLFLDYADIRVLNFFLQNILLFLIIKQLYRIHMERYAPAFLVAIFVINPLTAALSLQFSSVYLITLFSTICFLRLVRQEKATENRIDHLFFMAGILTAYFDFLTYPFTSCGILLVLYMIVNSEKLNAASIRLLFQKTVLWGCGYVGMWGGKWLVGSILLKENLFREALNQIVFRASTGIEQGADSRFGAVMKNISVLLKWPFLLVFASGGA